MVMTQAQLFATVRALGLSIRRTDYGEYRVAFKGTGQEASAYYTDDRQDALDTARAMHRTFVCAGQSLSLLSGGLQ